MARYHEIPKPPVFRGTEEEKWRQLRDYLRMVADQLEHVINDMSKEEKPNG